MRSREVDRELLDAVAQSIAAGEKALDEIAVVLAETVQRLRAAAVRVLPDEQADTGLRSALDVVCSAAADALEGRLTASRLELGTFNIAFFGRTGVGKSTLMSALGQLDGSRVSPGESDCTKYVEAIDWNGCRLYDTPGTGGWGSSRSELEERARRAVETADVVLLCFDTQSQQQSEFEKVAAWVQQFGKPAIAVLNFRNDRWRHPRRVQDPDSRRALSSTLRQHVENIHAELGRIGLPDVPVVALNSKRALAARATRPFRGPDMRAVDGELERYGAEYLERWSNIQVLEDVLSACLVVGGADLRLASLRDGLRAEFRVWAATLDGVAVQVAEQATVLERAIGQFLSVLGYPDVRLRTKHFAPPGLDGPDLLTELEALRGEPFDARVIGRLATHCRHLLRSHLSAERARTLRRAERLIANAFEESRPLDQVEFEREVFRPDAVAAAMRRVTVDVGSFLDGHLHLTGLEAREDLGALKHDRIDVAGRAGTVARRTGRVLEIGGLAAGGASAVLGVIALTNFWNPAGWTATAIIGGLTIASLVAGASGRRSRRLGEKARVNARAAAIGAARTAVSVQFDTWEDGLLQSAVRHSWNESTTSLTGLLQQALSDRQTALELDQIRAALLEDANAIPDAPSPVSVIARAIELTLGNASSTGTEHEVLLGEDWIELDVGAEDRCVLAEDDEAAFRHKGDGDRAKIRGWLEAATAEIDPHAVRRWLAEVGASGCLSGEDSAFVRELSVGTTRPQLAFVGDYGAGKTSLIKRLLADSAIEAPSDLMVHAGPATTAAATYRLGPWDLVDLPGFQGPVGTHTGIAVREVVSAGLVVVVVNTNLLLGDTSALEEVLRGSVSGAAKARRCLFVIGRIDDIGVDPEDAPRDFLNRCRRKEAELLSALRAHGFRIDADQIYSLAADPFGMVGDRYPVAAESYAEGHRMWDGVAAFSEPLVGIEHSRASKLAVAGDLDRVVAMLTLIREAQRHAIEILTDERADARLLTGAVEDALAELRVLKLSVCGRCSLLVEEHVNEMIGEALGAGPAEAEAVAANLATWWLDSRLELAVEALYKEFDREVEEWIDTNSSAIDRTFVRMEARADFGQAAPASVGRRDARGGRFTVRLLQESSRIVQAFGERDAVYRIGKAFNYKFRPWGAVKGGARVAKVGRFLGTAAAVLSAVTTAWDTYAFVRDLKAEDSRESARHSAADYARATAPAIVEQILRGTEDESGLLMYLDDQESGLKSTLDGIYERDRRLADAVGAVLQRVATLDDHLTAARELDQHPPEESR